MFISCKKLKIHLLYLLIILVKIEMTRQTDNVYRLDHAVTAKQKKGLKAALKFAKEHDMCMTEAQIQGANNM